jgi:23S rRNA (cytosine1962-C5)-methyltransferase
MMWNYSSQLPAASFPASSQPAVANGRRREPAPTPRAGTRIGGWNLSYPSVRISRRGEERIRNGHPWIYRSDVTAPGSDAALVRVLDGRDRVLGHALYSSRSEIALRLVSRGPAPPDRETWRARLRDAFAFRAALRIDATAYRLVHGEADLLPSLVVDRYGDYLIVQALSRGADRLLPEITPLLVELGAPAGILARNDPRVRALEGLEQKVEVLHGQVPDAIEVRDGGLVYQVDPYHGQKTGLFLDQRENRVAAALYARGRALDAFSYNGGFALALAGRCERVLAVDISEPAVARIRENARRNGLANVEARAMNVFDELRELERRGERFETIVLDPPAFAKNRAAVPKALAGYKEINLRALKLLAPGGFLVTCSCSYNVGESAFAEVIAHAAIDAHADVAVVEKRMQGRDHPVLMTVPETYYLKCFILRKLQ